MQRISITNPQNIIDGTAKKYYFKLRNTGGPKGDKGDKGDTGATGPQGPQGDPCTVVVNSTATLEPGSNAYVTNTGSLSNAVLNFGIPKGDRGPQGAKGDKGDKGDKGEQGNTGPQGPAGQNATVYVGTTTTGAPGTQASVYNSGTDRNATLNFTIPRGATGATGATGPQGPTGPAGQNFAPTVVTELPATGDSSKLYLTPKAHTTSTATGNPVTASVTEQAGALESFQLDGDTYQQSYTGKNLFNKNSYSDQTGYYIDGNGIWRSGGVNDHYFVFNIEPNTTYTFSKNAQASTNRFRVGISSEAPTVGAAFPIWGGGDTATEITLTTGSDSKYAYVYYSVTVNMQEAIQSLQIELGSTATTYEPYVGGAPSPNPDYPQQIQTVTGEQTVEIVGKNLIDPDGLELGNIDASGNDSASQQVVRSGYIRVAAGSYTLKVNNSENNINLWRYAIYDNSKTFVSANTPQAKSAAITIANNGYIRVSFYNVPWKDLTVQEVIGSQVQLELGSTASAYTPYTSTSYPLDLGSIELCKLGTYQDYIYKSGSDWKVHKATSKTTITNLSTITGVNSTSENTTRVNFSGVLDPIPNGLTASDRLYSKSDHFSAISNYNGDSVGIYFSNTSSGDTWFRANKTEIGTTEDSVKAWLVNNPVKLYYPIPTATDTVITDQTLIAQLEAVRTASLENGTNTITNSATAPNLAGDMEIGYYGYNPTNRYDKWLWLDINNEYEQIGS